MKSRIYTALTVLALASMMVAAVPAAASTNTFGDVNPLKITVSPTGHAGLVKVNGIFTFKEGWTLGYTNPLVSHFAQQGEWPFMLNVDKDRENEFEGWYSVEYVDGKLVGQGVGYGYGEYAGQILHWHDTWSTNTLAAVTPGESAG